MEERSEPSLQKEDMIFLLLYFVVVCVIKLIFVCIIWHFSYNYVQTTCPP